MYKYGIQNIYNDNDYFQNNLLNKIQTKLK
jgi:hypothetical protein